MKKKLKKYQGKYTGNQVQPAVADKTAVKINVPRYNPSAQAKKDAEEKLKIAKKLYKDNPGKVYSDTVRRAKEDDEVGLRYTESKKKGGSVKKKK